MNMDMSSTRVGVKCGRWNPTAEQVKVLTDLFSSGLRTPTTEQIQMISTHLNTFGKIESKNVFYWFQNHKARERHHKKRRRGSGGNGDEAICNMIRAPEKKEPKFCAKLLEQQAIREAKDQSRRVETLELFPLSSYSYEGEKWQKVSNEWREIPFMFEADIVNKEPPLDLRLSFL